MRGGRREWLRVCRIGLSKNGKNFSVAMASIILQKPPRLSLKALCDPGNVVDRDVALRSLHPAQIRPVDPAFVGQGFLA